MDEVIYVVMASLLKQPGTIQWEAQVGRVSLGQMGLGVFCGVI
jgi:hypothetical protein